MNEKLLTLLQHFVPQHTLSRTAGYLANTSIPWIKDPFIRWFINQYQVNMDEALETDPESYHNFNAFFTRALKPGVRPVCEAQQAIACPADGTISQAGRIENGRVFQAKGQDYSLTELLGGDRELAEQFWGGDFITIYLSPKDYHRVHMPLDGTLEKMIHIPGRLFSVNQATATHLPRLFARNERVVSIFNTQAGPMAIILVGAMIVASIETVWEGLITPYKRQVRTTNYTKAPDVQLSKGSEMGQFKLGSTAIVLFAANKSQWGSDIAAEKPVLMGEPIGEIFGQHQSET